jgi:phosphoglycerate dehydrogenase-like enzyme
MLPRPVFERGISVTHAAGAIAPAVADLSLMLSMLMLRHAYRHDRSVRAGEWRSSALPALGQEITAQRVGVVGAGYTGRCFIKLLRALSVETWVYDPYLSEERAGELDVKKVDLDDLLTNCRVVSMQVPSTPETYHMIGARELSLLQDGASLVNTARAHSIDQDALLTELKSGRIQAALDVFDKEPLPEDHSYRSLPNVFLTPHIAGASESSRRRQGDYIVQDIEQFLNGQPLAWEVTIDMLEIMA